MRRKEKQNGIVNVVIAVSIGAFILFMAVEVMISENQHGYEVVVQQYCIDHNGCPILSVFVPFEAGSDEEALVKVKYAIDRWLADHSDYEIDRQLEEQSYLDSQSNLTMYYLTRLKNKFFPGVAKFATPLS